jgi:hypothetical protein
VAAVAVVVEIAVVACGAAAPVEVAQKVVGGVAALAAEHGRVAGQGTGVEPGLEPAALGVPEGVGGVGPGRAPGERRRNRRRGGGLLRTESGEPRVVREGGEERVGEDAVETGRTERRGSVQLCHGRGMLALKHVQRGAVGRQQADRGMCGDQAVDDCGSAGDIAGLYVRGHAAELSRNRRHGEEVVSGLRFVRNEGLGAWRGPSFLRRGGTARERSRGREGGNETVRDGAVREGHSGVSSGGAAPAE